MSSSSKQVYFYSIHLFDALQCTISYTELNSVFNDIFDKYSIDNGEHKVLILEDSPKKVTMDILSNSDEFLFGKIGRLRDNGEMQLRHFNDLSCTDVIDPKEASRKGVESITYFLVDYKKAILCLIKGQYAPKPDSLNQIINKYTAKYRMEIKSIIDKGVVDKILKSGSISEVSYDIVVPAPELLGELGLTPRQLADFRNDDNKIVTITLKSEVRKNPLAKGKEVIKGIVDDFIENKNIIGTRVKTPGKKGKGTKEHDLVENVCTYKVKIDNECKGNIKSQQKEYHKKIVEAYNEEKESLLVYCDRYYD